jgi:hypothetical protein
MQTQQNNVINYRDPNAIRTHRKLDIVNKIIYSLKKFKEEIPVRMQYDW